MFMVLASKCKDVVRLIFPRHLNLGGSKIDKVPICLPSKIPAVACVGLGQSWRQARNTIQVSHVVMGNVVP